MVLRRKYSYTHFLISIYSVASLTFIILLSVALIFAHNQAKTVVSVASQLVANDLRIGSYRDSFVKLQKLSDQYFTHITFVDRSGKVLFETLHNDRISHIFHGSIDIQFKDAPTESLKFDYSLDRYIFFAFALFCLLIGLSIWPSVLFWRKLQTEQLAALQKQKDELLVSLSAKLSHDIRSPLGALKIALGRLSGETEAKELAHSALDRISSMAGSLLQGIRDSDFKPIAAEPKQKVHAWPVMSTLSSVCKAKHDEHSNLDNFELRLDCQVDSDVLAVGEPIEIEAILSNLINNSIDAFDGRLGCVTISARQYHDCIVVVVTDDGPGVSSEVIASLGHRQTTTKADGTGIALLNANSQIKRLGGSLRIDSQPQQGTMVTIQLKTIQ